LGKIAAERVKKPQACKLGWRRVAKPKHGFAFGAPLNNQELFVSFNIHRESCEHRDSTHGILGQPH
jgi:hypothetical protein